MSAEESASGEEKTRSPGSPTAVTFELTPSDSCNGTQLTRKPSAREKLDAVEHAENFFESEVDESVRDQRRDFFRAVSQTVDGEDIRFEDPSKPPQRGCTKR